MSSRVHLRDHCLTDRVVFVIVQIADCCSFVVVLVIGMAPDAPHFSLGPLALQTGTTRVISAVRSAS